MLTLDESLRVTVCPFTPLDETVDDELHSLDADGAKFGRGTLRFDECGCFGTGNEKQRRLFTISERLNGLFVLQLFVR